MTADERALIRACAAVVEARGLTDLALRLLALIPPDSIPEANDA